MRKILAMVLAVIMVMSLATVAFATEFNDDGTVATFITIPNNGHTYEAYRIFDGDYELVHGSTDEYVLTNIDWGNGITNEGKTALLTAFGATDVKDLKNKLSDSTESSVRDANARKVANTVADYLQNGTTLEAGKNPIFAGYYLVKDKEGTVGTGELSGAAATRYIIHVVGEVTLNPKASVPSVDKKQNVTAADAEYVYDALDQVIGGKVYYELTGTLPGTLDDYATYKYAFIDTMCMGLTYNDDAKVYIDGVEVAEQVESDGVTVTNYTISDETAETGITTLTVRFANIKAISGVTATSKVVVKYSATLNDKAAIGIPGNDNKVKLEFSNNPNFKGEPEDAPISETPETGVKVFTYTVKFDKVDNDNQTMKLPGAKFVLYKVVDNVNYYAIVNTQNKAFTWTPTQDDATVFLTDENGQFDIYGLDTGNYFLEETEAPAGYNIPDDAFPLHIHVEYKNNKLEATINNTTADNNPPHVHFDNKVLNTAQDENYGAYTATIANSKGSTLPSTGGMGTTLFYVVGAVLMITASVMLVTKKRMNNV